MMARGRMTVAIEGDFVVFLIGARVNNWLAVHHWLPVARSMPRMLAELAAQPDLGLLGVESYYFPSLLAVQYWRSFEALESYARSRDAQHLPMWVEFNRRIAKSNNVGIWHETFRVRSGEYEAIYVDMPPRGLGRFSPLIPISGSRESAKGRMGGGTTS